MGYWTWTDARVQPKQKQNHDYYAKDKIRYDRFAKIVCPDDTEIAEPRYTGYGIFGAYDAYELVVDWNKDDLPEIFDRLEKEHAWGCQLGEVARAYAAGKSKTQINEIVCRGIAEGKLTGTYLKTQWKRNIGIAIACEEKNTDRLRYPLKITASHKAYTYDELYPSYVTQ